jgi:hypothetical protein
MDTDGCFLASEQLFRFNGSMANSGIRRKVLKVEAKQPVKSREWEVAEHGAASKRMALQ